MDMIQDFRQHHDYPRQVVLAAAVYQAVMALLSGVMVLSALGLRQELLAASATQNEIDIANLYAGGILFINGLLALLFALAAISLFRQLPAGYLLSIVANVAALFLMQRSAGTEFVSFIQVLYSSVIVLLFLMDGRVKAYFGRGPYAEAYRQEERRRR